MCSTPCYPCYARHRPFDWILMYYSDPFVVLILALSFIGSIFFLHISAKIIRSLKK